MLQRYAMIVLLVGCAVPFSGIGQSIYKCGGNAYSNTPCAGGKVVEVVTPEQVATAARQTDAQTMLRMIRAGNVNGARQMAQLNNEPYQLEWATQTYQQEAAQEAQEAQNERTQQEEQQASQGQRLTYQQIAWQQQQAQLKEIEREGAEERQRKQDQAAQNAAIQAAAMQTQTQIQAQIDAQAAMDRVMGH